MWQFLLNLLPGGSVLTSVWNGITSAVKSVLNGLQEVIAHPATLTIVALAFCGGLYEGVRWSKGKVEIARAETAALKKQWADAEAKDKRLFDDAQKARAEAEERAKLAEERAGKLAGTAARRVRQPATPAPASAGAGQSVFALPKLFGTN